MKSNIIRTIKIIQEIIDFMCTNEEYIKNMDNKFIARTILLEKFKYYYKHDYWIFDNLWNNEIGYLTQTIKNLKNGIFRCKFCGRLFDSQNVLDNHYKKNDLGDHIKHNFACCQEDWCYCNYCGNFILPISLCNHPYPFGFRNGTVCKSCAEKKSEFANNTIDI